MNGAVPTGDHAILCDSGRPVPKTDFDPDIKDRKNHLEGEVVVKDFEAGHLRKALATVSLPTAGGRR